MSNYSSKEIQLRSKIIKKLDKIIEQKSVTKEDLIYLNQKFNAIKEENKNQFGNLANKAKNIVRVSTGLSINANLAKLQELYEDFKKKL